MLTKGGKVYKVEDDFDRDGQLDTWSVREMDVERASAKQIKLRRYYRVVGGSLVFPANALGRIFFATPHEAIVAFEMQMIAATGRAERMLEQARRGLAWARNRLPEEQKGTT